MVLDRLRPSREELGRPPVPPAGRGPRRADGPGHQGRDDRAGRDRRGPAVAPPDGQDRGPGRRRDPGRHRRGGGRGDRVAGGPPAVGGHPRSRHLAAVWAQPVTGRRQRHPRGAARGLRIAVRHRHARAAPRQDHRLLLVPAPLRATAGVRRVVAALHHPTDDVPPPPLGDHGRRSRRHHVRRRRHAGLRPRSQAPDAAVGHPPVAPRHHGGRRDGRDRHRRRGRLRHRLVRDGAPDPEPVRRGTGRRGAHDGGDRRPGAAVVGPDPGRLARDPPARHVPHGRERRSRRDRPPRSCVPQRRRRLRRAVRHGCLDLQLPHRREHVAHRGGHLRARLPSTSSRRSDQVGRFNRPVSTGRINRPDQLAGSRSSPKSSAALRQQMASTSDCGSPASA